MLKKCNPRHSKLKKQLLIKNGKNDTSAFAFYIVTPKWVAPTVSLKNWNELNKATPIISQRTLTCFLVWYGVMWCCIKADNTYLCPEAPRPAPSSQHFLFPVIKSCPRDPFLAFFSTFLRSIFVFHGFFLPFFESFRG